MGTEALIAKIYQKVDAEIAENKARLDVETEKAISEIEKNADDKYSGIIAAGKAEAEAYLRRESLKAQLEAKKNTLAEKNCLLDQTFALVKQMLLGMPENKKTALYTRLAIANIPDEGRVEVCASADMSIISKMLADSDKRFTVGSALSGEGILILSGEKCDIDLSISALADAVREETESAAASILFAEAE